MESKRRYVKDPQKRIEHAKFAKRICIELDTVHVYDNIMVK